MRSYIVAWCVVASIIVALVVIVEITQEAMAAYGMRAWYNGR